MIQSDIAGVLLVYIYVAILLVITEKLLNKYPTFSRKFLHIMVGNVAFLLPIFVTREIMAFVAAGPFIFLTFLMSPHSPIKSLKGKTSAAGHGMGLVYYTITWTVFAYVFFDHKEIIAIGIIAMSYGDGFASLIGRNFAKKKYEIYDMKKSYLGSFSLVIFTFFMSIVVLLYYGIDINLFVMGVLLFIAICCMVAEIITPWGLDNLSVPFIASVYYWMAMVM